MRILQSNSERTLLPMNLKHLLTSNDICKIFSILLALILISSCSSTSKQSSRSKSTNDNSATQQQTSSLSKALAARGFYKSRLGNINYINAPQCANYQVQSHRGAVRHPENSVNALIDALDNNFDVVEIDVRVTRDDVWVVHHDAQTGRETGTVDNKRRKIESLRYEKEWGYLRIRDQNTGRLLSTLPPSFRQIASAFSRNAKSKQLLNIEIKTKASIRDLEMLDYLAFKLIGQGRYFYSSLTLKNLSRMRDINSSVFLSFIQSPANRSLAVLRNDLEKGAGADPIFLRNKSLLEDLAGVASRRYKEYRYDDVLGMAKLKKSLKNNYGLAMDIRQYGQRASKIKRLVDQQGIPIATYTINGQAYHAKSLLSIKSKSRPTSVIIDDTLYGFCSEYGLPEMKKHIAISGLSKRLTMLPQDLDLERLDQINLYFDSGLYPAIGDQLKSIGKRITALKYTPVILNTTAGKKEAGSAVNLSSEEAIKIELRKGSEK
jgi:glycerophosphoryl diester phosphodiesterase|tara:strand:+ start:4680 stop:6152 length:1473 start_codon:yes stop_codon:yes gene_type:complete